MPHVPAVRFDFPDEQQASLAFSTLHELGYEPEMTGCSVSIRIERNDLISALEITAAHGGQFAGETRTAADEPIGSLYRIDDIPIPAHTVDPDWPESSGAELPDE